MRIRSVSAALVVLVAQAASAQTGHSSHQQRIDEAMPHFQRGVDLYDENDFTNALIEFRRAYDLAQDFHVLYNVAQTCYQLQNYACALDAFQRYVSQGTSLPRDRRAYVDKEISKLKTRVAQVTVVVSRPGADVLVDDEKVGTSPLPRPVTVSQGKRKIAATLDGKSPVTKTIEIAGGDSTTVRLDFEPEVDTTHTTTTAPPVVVPVAPVAMRHPIPWIAWGVAGGLAVVWGVTGVVALAYSSQAQSKLDTYGATANDITSAQNGAKAFALVSDIALGCTVVGLSVATVLTLLAKPVPVEKSAAAHVYVGPTGVTVLGHF